MRQPPQRLGLGALLGALLPDGDPVFTVRRRGDFSVSVGGRVAAARDVRIRRGSHLHRDSKHWASLRMAARRTRLGLAAVCLMLTEKLKARFGDLILSAQNERDEETFTINQAGAYDLFRALRDEPD